MTEFKYKSEVIGKNGICARIVAKSRSAYSGQGIVTFEYDAPKCILAQLNTHCMLAKNAQSSRAVPIKKVIEQVRTNPVTPVHWGVNQGGMVAGEEIDKAVKVPRYVESTEEDGTVSYTKKLIEVSRDSGWQEWADMNADYAEGYDRAGYHKQVPNRPMEAFTMVKGVITATEIDNFFHLRYHPDADPYIQELARCMWEAYELAETEVLYEGEWHTPYVEHYRNNYNLGQLEYRHEGVSVSLAEALKISAAACGQVSYRKLDLSEETVERVWNRLMNSGIIHASVVEHQATPIAQHMAHCYLNTEFWPEGVTHVDRDYNLWSAKFKHWIMHRKLIPNEVFKGKFTPPKEGTV